ncbi:MAG TPA: hypothetical protein VGF28_08525 [Thermoanaerobaculia bacterium]|jgi:hypothetical protein
MFGVAEDAVFDLEAIDREERQDQTDSRWIANALFIAFLLFVPGLYWWGVASAWAPVSYFVALSVAHPSGIWLTFYPVLCYAALDWLMARGVTLIITTVLERRFLRVAVAALLIAFSTYYALVAGYKPMHGGSTPDLNLILLLQHAFGPRLPGSC